MKKTLCLAFLVLALVGSLSTSVLADGGGGGTTCDPFSDPNCKIVTNFTGFAR